MAILMMQLLMLVFSLSVDTSLSARILMTSPQFRSHIIMQLAVGEELAGRGHDVYVAVGSQYPKHDAISSRGVKVLIYDYPKDMLYPGSDEAEEKLSSMVFNSVSGVRPEEEDEFARVLVEGCELMMSDTSFLQRVEHLKFDLAIIEAFVLSPCTTLLPYALDIPFLSLSGMYPPWVVRQPALPSFHVTPGPRGTTSPDLTTVAGRLSNLARYLGIHWYLLPKLWSNTTLIAKYACSSSRLVNNDATWYDLVSQCQLFIAVADHLLDDPVPAMPNYITVAGLSLRLAGPLPTGSALDRLFSESSGVILVSFGSTACHVPVDILNKFFEVFARLEETVIARFCLPDGVQSPKNVHVTSWLPQIDILGNPKTRLFITHCGLNGMHEAIYHGVPVLGMPLFAEQHWNCERATLRGLGTRMDIDTFTVDQLHDNIRQLLDNSTYREKAKRMSEIWRDEEPMIGRAKAAFWIEHVLKYGGEHLRPRTMDVPLYQLLMLDLIAVIALTMGGLFSLVVLLGVMIFKSYKMLASKPKDKAA